MLRQGYEVFARNLEELNPGREIEKQIRDTATYQTRVVRAIFTQERPKKPEEQVWVRALVGHLLDEKPWKIKIVKVLQDNG